MQITLIHATALLAEPRLDAHPIALLAEQERIEVNAASDGFFHITRAGGAAGFVPEALCGDAALAHAGGQPVTTFVSQPVQLYARPQPGSQYAGAAEADGYRWIVMPDEPLAALGRSDTFALVQRPNGQIGYIPLALSRTSIAGGPTRADRMALALIWAGLGFCWMLVVWFSVYSLLTSTSFVAPAARPLIGLGLLLAAAAALWLGYHRRLGRPFAAGMLLAYVATHLFTSGWGTMWRG